MTLGEESGTRTDTTWLITLAIVGNLAPGLLFLYGFFHDYSSSLAAALSNRVALAFLLDLVISTFFLAYLFARKPLLRWAASFFHRGGRRERRGATPKCCYS